ncbi:hypothetical protein [Lentzea terrae]|nr:hypothetical protein [Lentzea terrae]
MTTIEAHTKDQRRLLEPEWLYGARFWQAGTHALSPGDANSRVVAAKPA